MTKILILEDDRQMLKILSRFMQDYGEVYTTDTGPDAVRVIGEALAEGAPFSVALLDIMLPGGMSGHEALLQLRNLEEQYKRDGLDGAKVIMVTALNAPADIIQAFWENCEAYLTKPFTIEQLEQTLEKLGIYPIQ